MDNVDAQRDIDAVKPSDWSACQPHPDPRVVGSWAGLVAILSVYSSFKRLIGRHINIK